MLVVEGFQKFAGIPFGISRIFESLMPQQIGANRRKNRSIQVKERDLSAYIDDLWERIGKKLKKRNKAARYFAGNQRNPVENA